MRLRNHASALPSLGAVHRLVTGASRSPAGLLRAVGTGGVSASGAQNQGMGDVWTSAQRILLRQETGVCTRGKSRTASGRARCGLQARAAAGGIKTTSFFLCIFRSSYAVCELCLHVLTQGRQTQRVAAGSECAQGVSGSAECGCRRESGVRGMATERRQRGWGPLAVSSTTLTSRGVVERSHAWPRSVAPGFGCVACAGCRAHCHLFFRPGAHTAAFAGAWVPGQGRGVSPALRILRGLCVCAFRLMCFGRLACFS